MSSFIVNSIYQSATDSDANRITTRERPPGCRTIFVGGMPETITEEILRELFGTCGNICSIRRSKKKNFAHIRFDAEDSVFKALYISGMCRLLRSWIVTFLILITDVFLDL